MSYQYNCKFHTDFLMADGRGHCRGIPMYLGSKQNLLLTNMASLWKAPVGHWDSLWSLARIKEPYFVCDLQHCCASVCDANAAIAVKRIQELVNLAILCLV